jgi:hypothetical protein
MQLSIACPTTLLVKGVGDDRGLGKVENPWDKMSDGAYKVVE